MRARGSITAKTVGWLALTGGVGIVGLLLGTAGAEPAASLEEALREASEDAGVRPAYSAPSDPALVALGAALMAESTLSYPRRHACLTCHGMVAREGIVSSTNSDPVLALDLSPRGTPLLQNLDDYATSAFSDRRIWLDDEGVLHSPAGDDLPSTVTDVPTAMMMFAGLARDEHRGPFDADDLVAGAEDDDWPTIWTGMMERLFREGGDVAYEPLFDEAFPGHAGAWGYDHVAKGILAYARERFRFEDSPWDRWVAGDAGALSDEAKEGALLFFGSAGCARCHSGSGLSDGLAHNMGVPQVLPTYSPQLPLDVGAFEFTGDPKDRYAFRTPTLHNVAVTFPYMRNGVIRTLEGAVRHTLDPRAALREWRASEVPKTHLGSSSIDPAVGFAPEETYYQQLLATLDPLVRTPVQLTDDEVGLLLIFLESLSDPSFLNRSAEIPTEVPSGLTQIY